MSTDVSGTNRRRQLIVVPGLQKRLIAQCSAWPFATLAITTLLIGVAWRRVAHEFEESGAEVPSLGLLMVALAAIVGVSAFVVLHLSVVFSNRVAGPIYRVHKALEAMRDGDYSQRIKLRDRDLLPETADLLNETLEALERRHTPAPPAAPPAAEAAREACATAASV